MKHTLVSLKSATTAIAARQATAGSAKPEQTAISLPRTKLNSSKAHSSPSISLAQFDELPDSAYVRQPVVLGLFACSPATLWRWVKSSHVPSPRKMGNRISAWQVGELRHALRKIDSSGQVGAIAIESLGCGSKVGGEG